MVSATVAVVLMCVGATFAVQIVRVPLNKNTDTVKVSSQLLGSKQCTWGPAYWCSDVSKAKECGAIKHCSDNAWSKQEMESSETCDFCVMIVKDIAAMLKENRTQADIESYLLKACAAVKSYKEECTSLVKEYLPEIIAMIEAELDPKAVCASLKLCQAGRRSDEASSPLATVEVAVVPEVGGILCDTCKEYIQMILNAVQDANTEKQIESYLENVCDMIPDTQIAKMCRDDVDKWVPVLIKLMVKNIGSPEQACKQFGVCDAALLANGGLLLGDDLCQDCKTWVKQIQKLLLDKTTQMAVQKAVDELCQSFGGDYADQCKAYADEYLPLVFDFLATQLDPTRVCSALGLCGKGVPTTIPAAMILDVAQPVKPKEDTVSQVSDGAYCALCEFAMKEIDTLLQENSTQQEIIKAVEKVCSILPSTLKSECVAFIDEYGQAIINLLTLEVSPQQVCAMLGLCASSKSTQTAVQPVKANKEECIFCKMIITYLATELENNATDEEIEKEMELLCKKLTARASLQQRCQSFVEKWGDLLLRFLAKAAKNPDLICSGLDLCPARVKFGAQSCMYGPTFWCSSMETARRCDAEEHCRLHVWNRGTLVL